MNNLKPEVFMYYKPVAKNRIYRLINTNPLMLISTVSKAKEYDIAPIAWLCPQEMDPPRILICIDTGHQTFKNIKETGKFIACIPHISQIDIVKKTGGVSGRKTDKFANFRIKTFIGKKTGCKIPEGVISYLECKTKKIIRVDSTAIVIADIVFAAVDENAFNGERLLVEKQKCKAIYHIGGEKFATFGDKIKT